MKVLLITGSAGAVQGWGNLETTIHIRNVLKNSGKEVKILYVNSETELIKGLDTWKCDIAWSSLYHLSKNEDYIGPAIDELWVADILNQRGIPYVGSNAQTLKNLINKSKTIKLLKRAKIAVPEHSLVNIGEEITIDSYPRFVKPCFESESNGISEQSVVHSEKELIQRLHYIHNTFYQPALIEEYLPGREFTVTVLGNGSNRRILPVLNIIREEGFEKYPVITIDAKINNHIYFEILEEKSEEAAALAKAAAEELECFDHVRIDMREDAGGKLKILEVNGIPGLHSVKSRSLHICELYYQDCSKEENFRSLINTIIDSAITRYKNDEILAQSQSG